MDELASLQESAREIALERFRIIQPYLEQDRSLSVIARNAGIPYRTIHRWLTRYRRFGLVGLLQLAAFSFRTIKYWSGFAGDF